MSRLKVLVLFGGMAEEHDVSIKSAKQLTLWLNPNKHEAIYVYITREGAWRRVESPQGDLSRGTPVMLSADRSQGGLWMLEGGAAEHVSIDVAFPMLHGHFGEDGAMQGLLELSGTPYVGCGVAASALGMDKSLAYLAAQQAGVRVPRYVALEKGEALPRLEFPYPAFVKPARSGSSFGVNKVCGDDELEKAIAEARHFDDKVLIEEAVSGLEVGCAVMGEGDDLITGEIDQIELSGGFFRIHQEKQPEQGSENATIHVPAHIAPELRKHAAETAKTIYSALGCRGLARVDMFMLPNGTIVLNEVNTMPGFTSYSRYPRMMEAARLDMARVVERLIAMALKEAC